MHSFVIDRLRHGFFAPVKGDRCRRIRARSYDSVLYAAMQMLSPATIGSACSGRITRLTRSPWTPLHENNDADHNQVAASDCHSSSTVRVCRFKRLVHGILAPAEGSQPFLASEAAPHAKCAGYALGARECVCSVRGESARGAADQRFPSAGVASMTYPCCVKLRDARIVTKNSSTSGRLERERPSTRIPKELWGVLCDRAPLSERNSSTLCWWARIQNSRSHYTFFDICCVPGSASSAHTAG
jgi:hypothetical protein